MPCRRSSASTSWASRFVRWGKACRRTCSFRLSKWSSPTTCPGVPSKSTDSALDRIRSNVWLSTNIRSRPSFESGRLNWANAERSETKASPAAANLAFHISRSSRRTRKSTSKVGRVNPCAATAYPPMMRYPSGVGRWDSWMICGKFTAVGQMVSGPPGSSARRVRGPPRVGIAAGSMPAGTARRSCRWEW